MPTARPETEIDPPPDAAPAATDESDATLVAAVRSGDVAAFGRLANRYQRSAYATCWAVLKDSHLAADAAQESFLAAYRSLGSLRDANAFGGWLTAIARNRAMRLARRRVTAAALPVTVVDPRSVDPPPDPNLLAAVASLPEHERTVTMLRYFEGHDVAEIAAILGRPLGTVTKQLSRAHDRLRRTLAKEDRP